MHIAHAHSELLNQANLEVSGINNEHQEPIIPHEETNKMEGTHGNVNSINIERVDDASVSSNNVKKPTGNFVISTNNKSNTPNISHKTAADLQPDMSETAPDNQLNDTQQTFHQTTNVTSRTTLIRDDQRNSGHHKRRPKPKGKHHRPTPKPPTDHEQLPSAHSKSRKSAFVTVTHGIRKIKKIRHYKCNICEVVSDSQAAANTHYRAKHPPLKCPNCTQTFNNPCSLRQHKYNHKELRFPCHSCSKSFAFESDLNNHRLKHRCHPGHQCNHHMDTGVCGKWFFAKSDLNEHAKIHEGHIYQCFECGYTTLDKRYLHAHQYTHSDLERYTYPNATCLRCFKHHTQMKRHLERCGTKTV